jgi:hypothetical protein
MICKCIMTVPIFPRLCNRMEVYGEINDDDDDDDDTIKMFVVCGCT